MYGIPREQIILLVEIAADNGKLGAHIRAPYTCMWPEEQLQLAESVLLQMEVRGKHQGTNPWTKIVDRGIYYNSIRDPMLQKGKRCEDCKNTPSRSGSCTKCKHIGKVYEGRRYWPRMLINQMGRLDQTPIKWWWSVMDGFILSHTEAEEQENKIVMDMKREMDESNTMLMSIPRNFTQPDVAEKKNKRENYPNVVWSGATEEPTYLSPKESHAYVRQILNILNLRLPVEPTHTPFTPPLYVPVPAFRPKWINFFQSVVDAYDKAGGKYNAKLVCMTCIPLNRFLVHI